MRSQQKLINRIETALAEVKQGENLVESARELKENGVSRDEIYQAFDYLRARHESDQDETKYDAVLDTMDFIVGWCHPDHALSDDDE